MCTTEPILKQFRASVYCLLSQPQGNLIRQIVKISESAWARSSASVAPQFRECTWCSCQTQAAPSKLYIRNGRSIHSAMLKNNYLVGAYHGLQRCCYCSSNPSPTSISSTSPHNLPVQRARPRPQYANKRRRVTEPSSWPWPSRRHYATVRDTGGVDFRDNMNWPCRNGQSVHATGPNPFVPSPYEIFDMQRRDTYGKHTKLKYYELVKIYHPDRSGTRCEGLSSVERLERVCGPDSGRFPC